MNTEDSRRDEAKTDDGEPSMEDILASIRRILSDDGKEDEPEDFEETVTVDPARSADPPPEDPDNVVEFSTSAPQAEDAASADADRIFEPAPSPFDAAVDDNPFDAPPPPASPQPRSQLTATASNVLELTPQMRLAAEQALMSGTTRDQSTDVLTQLARAILEQRELTVASSQVTLEGMVREMLRPLLREWLDQNLPHLIERLVKREIDQIVNRAERRER